LSVVPAIATGMKRHHAQYNSFIDVFHSLCGSSTNSHALVYC